MNIEQIRTELFLGRRIFDIPLRVTFYSRVSTGEEKQLDSLAHQSAYFESKIRQCQSWTFVPGYIDEGITGTRADKRPQFQKMICDAKAGAFDLILTKEVSRFARDIVDCVQTVRNLLRCEVGVMFEDINLNTMDKDAEFRLSVMAIVAQEESRKISERVKFGYRQTMKNGKRHGAAPPIGYRFNNENNGDSVDERRAKLVRYVFETYAKGELGTRRIADELAKRGFFNDAGNPYHPSTIERMIRNPVYMGYIVNGKTRKPSYREDKKIAAPREQWQLHYDPVRVPPLVSAQLWERANHVLAQRSRRMKGIDCTGKDAAGLGKYAYSGRIVCGEHGCTFHRCVSRWMAGNAPKQAEYWRCSLHKKYGQKRCCAPVLYKRDLDAVMRKLFSPLIPQLKDICTELSRALCFAQKQKSAIPEAEKRMAALQRRKNKLLDGWINGVVSDDDYQHACEQLQAQIRETQNLIAQSRTASAAQDTSSQNDSVFQQAMRNANLESEQMLDELVRCFVDKIVVKSKETLHDQASYLLEIWLKDTPSPVSFDLALCERTHLNPGRHTAP